MIVKLHTMIRFDHPRNILIVYLRQRKRSSMKPTHTPPDTPSMPLTAPTVPYAASLYDNIQRLTLDVHTIGPFHGSPTVGLEKVNGKQVGSNHCDIHWHTNRLQGCRKIFRT